MGNGMEIPAYNRFYRLWKEGYALFLWKCVIRLQMAQLRILLTECRNAPCHCDIHPGNVKWKDGQMRRSL